MTREQMVIAILKISKNPDTIKILAISETSDVKEIYDKLYNKQSSISKYEKGKIQREKAKAKAELEEHPYLIVFGKNCIKAGDIVKFKGTKGIDTRQVVSINGTTISSMVVNLRRRSDKLEKIFTGYGSSNSMENLKAYLDENEDTSVWRDRTWMIHQGHSLTKV